VDGPSARQLIERAQDAAHEAAQKVQKTAGSVADAAGRIVAGGDA